jgi:alpha-galactosidase
MIETEPGHWSRAVCGAGSWEANGVRVRLVVELDGVQVYVACASRAVRTVSVEWAWALPPKARILNDHWERGYGDFGWMPFDPDRVLPWYTTVSSPAGTWAIGVQTGGGAICRWEMEAKRLRLVCDLRTAADGVEPGDREIHAAGIVQAQGDASESAFEVVRTLCRAMCDAPLTPEMPVYGVNDWYYAYGNSTAKTIERDARLLSELTHGLDNRPFCVVDAGFQIGRTGCSGLPAVITNRRFPDMGGLAATMRSVDVRPGLWVRLLRTHEHVPPSWLREAPLNRGGDLLDPSIPEVIEYGCEQIRTLIGEWGYEMVKHDFSTVDIFGRWGSGMGVQLCEPSFGNFRNRDRTTAEVIVDFYGAIREAAGSAIVIGCNTMGHLAAGLVEVQRIGDDTSGLTWGRTRRMGVNTLAFRGVQQGAFFGADADCVGLTEKIPWALNRQWLDLVARSGTPLFVSADPAALGRAQRDALIVAFAAASVPQPLAEPLDWMDSVVPSRWLIQGRETTYDWFGEDVPTRCAFLH